MYNMTGDEYALLYKRYLKRSPKELFEYAGFYKGDIVWDLCAGSTLRASKVAVEMGAAKVIAIDANSQIEEEEIAKNEKIICCVDVLSNFFSRSMDLLSDGKLSRPDIVICQQAINYWFSEDLIAKLHYLMRRNSKFVFNTFNKKPSHVPRVTEYEIDSLKYVEVVYTQTNNIYTLPFVCHVQIVEGMEPHITQFLWIDREEYERVLKGYFKVKRITQKSTDIYVCTKE